VQNSIDVATSYAQSPGCMLQPGPD